MVELAKLQSQQPEPVAQAVTIPLKDHLGEEQIIVLQAGPSQFGRNLKGDEKVTAEAVIVHPFKGCVDLWVPEVVKDKIAIMERGDCMFIDKVRKVTRLIFSLLYWVLQSVRKTEGQIQYDKISKKLM
ncbi:unnamed protein product [Acanthoscelides obtectus]|uniref:Uncharacterized protein n=1 Tax=Acanthoscelides obtectus TaxID=200917 RepID=A0A9P0M3T4_ACAOB|nr:unnamed protein product [Acanthoscelides obtectus]CAK1638821.1 ER degradation-enhancing alpha-mannosidase-like protein 3 [Acanthoscelides obtectus]